MVDLCSIWSSYLPNGIESISSKEILHVNLPVLMEREVQSAMREWKRKEERVSTFWPTSSKMFRTVWPRSIKIPWIAARLSLVNNGRAVCLHTEERTRVRTSIYWIGTIAGSFTKWSFICASTHWKSYLCFFQYPPLAVKIPFPKISWKYWLSVQRM